MLKVSGLSFNYPGLPLLKNIDFTLNKGQLLHLQGKNGAGKTTLMRILAGLLEAESGKIHYNGHSTDSDLRAYQKNLCFIGHKSGLNPLLTLEESCYFDPHWDRKSAQLNALLKSFQLTKIAKKPCFQLSQGQLHRASLLRLALTDAPLWLIDEPFVALDEDSLQIIALLMNEQLRHGGQIILTSHQALPPSLSHPLVYRL